MMPTFPGFRLARRTNLRSAPSVTMSEWAAANPSRLSASTVSGALISFFTTVLPRSRFFVVVDQPRQALHEFSDRLVEFVIALLVAEIGQIDGVGAHAAVAAVKRHAARVRLRVGVEEELPVVRRKVADLEDRFEMSRRDRRWIR